MLVLAVMLTLTFNIESVKASGTIYIRADGSIDPPTAPIQLEGNVYTFTDNIYDSIIIERDNIVVDGAGYNLQGVGTTESWGINLTKRNNVSIENVQVEGFLNGIYVDESSTIRILGNNVTANSRDGIYIRDSSDVEVSSNTVYLNDRHGIYVYFTSDNTISNNNAYLNGRRGISVGYCNDSTLLNNKMTGNTYNFNLFGDYSSNYENSIDLTNTVDGKPIYYLRNMKDNIYDADSNGGAFYLINCDNITIKDQVFVSNGVGITLWNTTKSKIENIIISKNERGIRIREGSWKNIVSDVFVTSNEFAGVDLRDSYENIFSDNTFSNNYWGMFIYNSNSNTVSGNLISNNKYGLALRRSSSDNLFLHDNFVDNLHQCDTRTFDGSPNFWNNTLSGNYWSDYSGADSDRDGIGDTPYVIDANNTDHYPLMGPWSPSSMIKTLIRAVKFWTDKGTEKSLENKLKGALHLLDAEEDRAVHRLICFTNQVNAFAEKKLTFEQAEFLTSTAQTIVDSIKG